MHETLAPAQRSGFPAPLAVLELFKPITWFAPMWAFMCGVVSSGAPFSEKWHLALAGSILAGPMICATSQAVNDWYDRHVDAINEPNRPIPSGRIPGQWGLWIAIIWTCASLAFAATLGIWVCVAATLGIFLAWAYSAPPLRLKQSGWWGPAGVALSYEGITWFTGAAVVTQALPDPKILILAGLYALGAHGIMTLNDFKAVEGDRQLGLRSLPVIMGVDKAARFACAVMALPQIIVVALLVHWGLPYHGVAVGLALVAQFGLMRRLLSDPLKHTPWYNATGTSLYVLGMLASAIAVGSSLGGHP
ncbi:chlorophyll synthase ChlG [Candidatus Phycosocius spiralis]|uniref:Bacteriochlorophyll/chlorophyll a synthase n=1 Tax=Candidatus Phycosocius spiralis TaxID=2815099 RepID=A0ABQ4PUR9_9PROT|nr:chlorophyll synthase ChlG [Candidatus Phycosocius spiralis]GIU66711.1 bacteriochlorophyll/chlorophyll a synthase [Candidatus Phycosocius spiralis]